MEQKKSRRYRLAPAYILLFLAQENLYGSAILSRFHDRLPNYSADSAAVYRSLQELEKEHFVKSSWMTDAPGPATKWYEITPEGRKKLDEYRKEIEIRKSNLDFFLREYGALH